MFCSTCVGREPPTRPARPPQRPARRARPLATVSMPAEEEKKPAESIVVVEEVEDVVGTAKELPSWPSWERVALCAACAVVLAWWWGLREGIIFALGALAGTADWLPSSSSREGEMSICSEQLAVPATPATDARIAARLALAVKALEATAASPAEAGWNKWGRREDVDIWVRINESTGIKNSVGLGRVSFSAAATAAAIESDVCKTSYDRQWKRTTLLRPCDQAALSAEVGPELTVESFVLRRDEYHPVFPASARDCVVAYCRLRRSDGAVLLCLASIIETDDADAHAFAADDRHYVRMHIDVGGYLCRPLTATEAEVVCLVDLDPRGSVPTAVINFVAVDRPMAIARLRKLPEIPVAGDRLGTYETRLAQALDALLEADRDPSSAGFVSLEKKDRVAAYVADARYALTRGELTATPAEAHNCIMASAAHLDRMRDAKTALATVGRTGDVVGAAGFVRLAPTAIVRLTYKPIFFTSPRDAVLAISDLARPSDGARVRVATSVDHPSAPPDPKRVRMAVVANGWLLKPAASGTLATNLYKVDPNGGLPRHLLLRLATARTRQIPVLRSLLEDKAPPPSAVVP